MVYYVHKCDPRRKSSEIGHVIGSGKNPQFIFRISWGFTASHRIPTGLRTVYFGGRNIPLKHVKPYRRRLGPGALSPCPLFPLQPINRKKGTVDPPYEDVGSNPMTTIRHLGKSRYPQNVLL